MIENKENHSYILINQCMNRTEKMIIARKFGTLKDPYDNLITIQDILTPCDRWSLPVLYSPNIASKFLGDLSK